MNVRVRKTIAILTSALIVPMTLPGLSSTVSAHEEMPVLSGSYEEKTVDAIHAYDPITDLEKERNYRNSVSVVQNKIIFSVIDKRVVGSTPVRFDDKSDLCRKYNLSDTEFIYETIINDSECNAGIEKYEVFYEASIEETDIWEYTDL